jgi:mRNA turnover protein 4
MPRSKRVRKVNLTNTRSKGRALKTELVARIRDAVEEFEHIYVFSFENMRSNLFKSLRNELAQSRIFLGKNKVSALALGRDEADEYMPDLYHVGDDLSGQRGLLFTNSAPDKVRALFNKWRASDFARGGMVAPRTVTLPQGPLPTMINSMIQPLRKLGLRVQLKRGIVTLEDDTNLCTKGEELTPEAARLLKLFDHRLAEFKLDMVSHWSEGEYESFVPQEQ